MTSGLLTLVGLIAIFVSINTQRSVEKAKDLLEELQSFELNHELGELKNGRKLKWILEHYKRQVKLNISNLSVIIIAILTICLAGVFWCIYAFFVSKEITEGLIFVLSLIVCSVLILCSFVWLLFSLISVTWLSRIPRYTELIMPNNDKTKNFDVDIIKLMGYTMVCSQVYLMRHTLVGIAIYFPITDIVDKLRDKIEVQVLLESKQGRTYKKTLVLSENEYKNKYLANRLYFETKGQQAKIVDVDEEYNKIIINVFIIYEHGIYLTKFSDQFPQKFANNISPAILYPKNYADNVNWFLLGESPLEYETRYLLEDSTLLKGYVKKKS